MSLINQINQKVIKRTTKTIRNKHISDALSAFNKGTKPEYKVVSRIKDSFGTTQIAEFEKISGIKGYFNRQINKFNYWVKTQYEKINAQILKWENPLS